MGDIVHSWANEATMHEAWLMSIPNCAAWNHQALRNDGTILSMLPIIYAGRAISECATKIPVDDSRVSTDDGERAAAVVRKQSTEKESWSITDADRRPKLHSAAILVAQVSSKTKSQQITASMASVMALRMHHGQ
jgi:hypothetical protein